ncbi:bifunctional indole-3-glycerol phosphate synthase/phosphoribosylanthranilate isomerase [Fusibacter paucivorans]|uniref:N-(5'-phosphoribosyl)anthranilate isomerase n=1 Tax=Fusibacter paucivorans TaxID=76009 RepID=A0ABS5PLG5_9FIRM|nr:bifunctional indole-3-glycerol phosphate synthase/phosphoribosylanthranilate isomerase [Fusibacter paucivorans]MBS7525727.1 bifunctional indole-3-glycerol phosphate synthase/phosphoribosylanthranilate isomerase [Fusibacter paucivorans]
MNILNKIYAYKKIAYPIERPSLKAKLLADDGPHIIGEIKRGSPSKGLFAPDLNIESTVSRYEAASITGYSVLTDKRFFYGGFEDLHALSELTLKPILCKDFIVSPDQIAKAFAGGAKVILLIARMLDTPTMEALIDFAHTLNMEVLMEIHDANEFAKIEHLSFDILGINNRDLETFETDIMHSINVYNQLKLADKPFPVISESGFKHYDAVLKVTAHGFNGVLIGEGMVKDLIKPKMSVKICGISEKKHLEAAFQAGASHAGFVLAESKRKIDIATCGEFCKAVRSDYAPMKSVIVLKDVNASEVNALYASVKPDYIQIHGYFREDVPLEDSIKLIRAFSGELQPNIEGNDLLLQRADIVLLDAAVPGSGECFDWDKIEQARQSVQKPLWIAGGLSKKNIALLLSQYQIDGVDVSSGVETQGIKDEQKIRGFVEEVRRREHEIEIR